MRASLVVASRLAAMLSNICLRRVEEYEVKHPPSCRPSAAEAAFSWQKEGGRQMEGWSAKGGRGGAALRAAGGAAGRQEGRERELRLVGGGQVLRVTTMCRGQWWEILTCEGSAASSPRLHPPHPNAHALRAS